MEFWRREVWLYSKRLRDQHDPDIDYQPLGERQIRLIEFRLFYDEDRLIPIVEAIASLSTIYHTTLRFHTRGLLLR